MKRQIGRYKITEVLILTISALMVQNRERGSDDAPQTHLSAGWAQFTEENRSSSPLPQKTCPAYVPETVNAQ